MSPDPLGSFFSYQSQSLQIINKKSKLVLRPVAAFRSRYDPYLQNNYNMLKVNPVILGRFPQGMKKMIRAIPLANGLTVRFYDASRRYFGDYHQVRVEVSCEVLLTQDLFQNPEDF